MTSDEDRALVLRALEGRPEDVRALLARIGGVVQARAARALFRRRGGSGRDARQEVEDMAQEVFLALFADDGKVLRAWDHERGLSLENFVGLVAEREVSGRMRSGKRNPWRDDPIDGDALDRVESEGATAEASLLTRDVLTKVAERLREELSTRGLELFYRLLIDEEPLADVCAATGLTKDAAYAWKSRLSRRVREIVLELAESMSKLGLPPQNPTGTDDHDRP